MRPTILALCALATTILAQNRDSGWINPSSDSPDFSVTSTIGEEIVFSWNALNSSMAHLYIVAWDQKNFDFNRMVHANVDISIPGEFRWVNDVGTFGLSKGRKFRMLFWPAASQYSGQLPNQIVSPGFFIAGDPKTIPAGGTDLTASASSRPSVFASTSASPTSLSTPSSRPSDGATNTQINSGGTSQDEDQKEGLSTAAQAGLGVGIAVGAILLLAMAYHLGRRQRRQPPNANYVSVDSSSNLNFRPHGVKQPYVGEELVMATPVYRPRAETDGDRQYAREVSRSQFELPGSTASAWHHKA